MMIKGQYFYEFPGVPSSWFYQDETSVEATYYLEYHVMATGVAMEAISPLTY